MTGIEMLTAIADVAGDDGLSIKARGLCADLATAVKTLREARAVFDATRSGVAAEDCLDAKNEIAWLLERPVI